MNRLTTFVTYSLCTIVLFLAIFPLFVTSHAESFDRNTHKKIMQHDNDKEDDDEEADDKEDAEKDDGDKICGPCMRDKTDRNTFVKICKSVKGKVSKTKCGSCTQHQNGAWTCSNY